MGNKTIFSQMSFWPKTTSDTKTKWTNKHMGNETSFSRMLFLTQKTYKLLVNKWNLIKAVAKRSHYNDIYLTQVLEERWGCCDAGRGGGAHDRGGALGGVCGCSAVGCSWDVTDGPGPTGSSAGCCCAAAAWLSIIGPSSACWITFTPSGFVQDDSLVRAL